MIFLKIETAKRNNFISWYLFKF